MAQGTSFNMEEEFAGLDFHHALKSGRAIEKPQERSVEKKNMSLIRRAQLSLS